MKLVVIGGGNMGLTYAKGIHQAGLLNEKISILGIDNLEPNKILKCKIVGKKNFFIIYFQNSQFQLSD